MPSLDISRSANDPAKRYTGVHLQQGRVLVDDDWNESERITHHERVESLVDLIGPSGTSDDALLPSNVHGVGGNVDFDLGVGTVYVGGRRLRVPTGQSYLFQDDFFAPPGIPTPTGERHDLVWVEVKEVPVTALEDAELREVGLGGPDTAARIRLVAQVHVEPDVADDCEEAWEATAGADVDDRGILATDASLTVGLVDDLTPEDLCAPGTVAGYLSHMNQAIRVQAIDATHFTWGFDNASAVYRVDLGADRQTVRFRNSPVDDAHRPRAGQVVEFLPWGSVLPNNQLQAAATGAFAVVGTSYDPDLDELVLAAPVPAFGELDWVARPDAAALEADGRYVYLRVWDRGDDASAPAIAMGGASGVPLGTTGLSATFAGTANPGDFWIIAARPAEPEQVVPWALRSGRAPHGPVRARAPIALLRWAADGSVTVHDCRRRFRPLTELRGCCEIAVGDGSHSFGDVESIQEAVDLLPPEGGRICVYPGTYPERVVIANRTFVEISGCGPDVIVAPEGGTGPVFSVDNSTRVRLKSMRIVAAGGEGVLVGGGEPCRGVRLESLQVDALPTAPGVRLTSPDPARQPSEGIDIRDCRVEVSDLESTPEEGVITEMWPAVWIQGLNLTVTGCTITAGRSKLIGGLGGIQIAGLSRNIDVVSNDVRGGNGHGITVGSVLWATAEATASAAADYEGYAAAAIITGWYTWFDGGCINVGGEAPDDPDDDTPPLVPLSQGPVRDLVIEHNTIAQMGADGIGVARFFEPVEGAPGDIITLDRVRIVHNEIMGNRTTPPPVVSSALARMSGHGGISLASVRDLRLQSNRIAANGPSGRHPVCGVFILRGQSLLMTDNDIMDNGANPSTDGNARIGNRGGVFVKSCRDMAINPADYRQSRNVGAITIHDNRILQPMGQAIWVLGSGRMSVHDNQITAGGLGITDIIRAVAQVLETNLDDLGDAAILAVQHLVGTAVTIINTGLPFDLVSLVSQRKATGGAAGMSALADSFAYMATPAGSSAYDSAVEDETSVADPVPGVDDQERTALRISQLLAGGHVSVNDNNVALDMFDETVSISLCSVLVLSLDDVAVQHNQFRCLTYTDFVLVDVVAVALMTLRCEGNRVQDAPLGASSGAVLLSAATWSTVNTTTGNQTTRPLFAGTADPLLLINEHNQALS